MINYGLVGYGLNGFSHVMELSKFPLLQGRSILIAEQLLLEDTFNKLYR